MVVPHLLADCQPDLHLLGYEESGLAHPRKNWIRISSMIKVGHKIHLDLKIDQNEKDNKWLTILIDMFSSFLSIWFPMRSLLAWRSSTSFVLPHCERFAVACVASVSLNVDNTPCWKLDSLVVLEATKLVPVRFLRLLWNKLKLLRNLIEGTTLNEKTTARFRTFEMKIPVHSYF